MQHTNLETSKIIHAKVPELETEHYRDKQGRIVHNKQGSSIYDPITQLGTSDIVPYIPTHTLTDCFKAIQMHFDPTGWADSYAREKMIGLLDMYVWDGMTIGKNCNEYLISLFQ